MKRYVIVLICLVLVSSSFAQALEKGEKEEKVKKPFKERLVTGGDIILNFGNNGTLLGASPLIGYKVTERYIVGVGVTYIYGSFPGIKTQTLGERVFNRFKILDELYVHGEFEQMNFVQEQTLLRTKQKLSFPALLLGAGYQNRISPNSSIGITVLYDVLQHPNSYYNGLIFRGGVNIGF